MAAVGALHAVLLEVKVGCREVLLVSELMKARQQEYYRPCLLLSYVTSRHLCGMLQVQCLCRSRLRSRSRLHSGQQF